MSTANSAQKFKKTFNNFISKMKQWNLTPEQKKELVKIELKAGTAMQINCRGVIGIFVNSVEPYATHILENDEDYFLKNSFVSESEDVDLQSKFKEWWPDFDQEQKTFIMKHIKLLLMLGCMATENENLRQIINKYRDPSNPLVF